MTSTANAPAAREDQCHISTERWQGITTVRVDGDLDAAGAVSLRNELAALTSAEALVVDLREVGFIDSAGIGALIGAIRRSHAEGDEIVIVANRGPLRRALELVGIAALAPVVHSMADAEEAVKTLLYSSAHPG